MVAVFTPYTVLCIIPALVGIVGDRYLSRLKYDLQTGSRYFLIGNIANALLIAAVCWLGGVMLALGYAATVIGLVSIPSGQRMLACAAPVGRGMSRSLLNIAKRSLPRLTLRGVGLASKDAV